MCVCVASATRESASVAREHTGSSLLASTIFLTGLSGFICSMAAKIVLTASRADQLGAICTSKGLQRMNRSTGISVWLSVFAGEIAFEKIH